MSNLNIELLSTSPSGKTNKWVVKAKQGNYIIGEIRWWGRWRKYVLFAYNGSVWDEACLTEIAAFLKEETVKILQKAREECEKCP